MAFSAIIGAVVFGVVFGIGKLSEHGWLRWPCWAVVEFFRAVPVIMLMIFCLLRASASRPASVGATGPSCSPSRSTTAPCWPRSSAPASTPCPRGQAEAAYAIGMRKTQVMTLVLLPQAVKIMIPAIISQMVVALKDTSLGYVVAGARPDPRRPSRSTSSSRTTCRRSS